MRLKVNLRQSRYHSTVISLFVTVIILVCSRIAHGAPPESIGIPILSSILSGKSSEGLKQLVQSHTDKLLPELASAGKNEDINQLISKLNPSKGTVNPVMVDMLSALDRTYRDTTAAAARESSTEQFPDDDPASNRVASSTEENGIIWQDTFTRPQKREFNRFSSRYRSNKTKADNPFPSFDYTNENYHNNASTENGAEHNSSVLPFSHVTDPNLRNHRLYAWEFETYKNFTHIDQAEDLMADEDHATETKVSVVAAPPPSKHPSQQENPGDKKDKNTKIETISNVWSPKPGSATKSKRVKVKGYPHIVISLEDTSDHGYGKDTYNVHLQDSGEHSLNQRPREPLRHSSNENIVYVHGGSGEEERYPYSIVREHPNMQEMEDRYPDERSSHQFRPSAADLSDAVFMDPDQDFFTSTVRNQEGQMISDQEISSETLPKRRRKKLKKMTKKEEIEELTQSDSRFHSGNDRRNSEYDHLFTTGQDRSNHGIQYSPEYSKNVLVGTVNEDRARAHLGNIHSTPGPHLPIMKPTKYAALMESNRMKSDRVLSTGGDNAEEYLSLLNQGQAMSPSYDQYDSAIHHHDGGIGNYYSLHNDPGLHSNLGAAAHDTTGPYGQKQNYELTSTEYLGNGNRIQNALSALNLNNIFGNTQQAQKKLQAAVADQVIAPGNIEDFYHPYAASDHQVNQYYEDSYATSWSNTWYILAALIAFTAIFALLLPMFLSTGRMGKKGHRNDLDDDDLDPSPFQPSGSNNNYHYDNTNNDVNQNSDVWTEIKGVYNDLVNMFRGDYGLLSKLKREPDQGPKIVYRDEEDMEDEDSDEDEEDDEKTDHRVNNKLRNRKREQYIKKQKQIQQKEQQQELKRQQQQQTQQQQQQLNQQPKSHVITKKTLVSKIKAEAGRDNKDNGKTIHANSVNNLVVVSGPGGPMGRKVEDEEEEHSSPRAVTGFVLPENGTLATMPFINVTGFGNAADSFLREWAQVQLINNH